MKNLIAMFLVAAGGVSHAQTKPLTVKDATMKALALIPGKVLEVEKEKHKGESVFSVEIEAKDGVHEVVVRISDGKVLQDALHVAGHDDDDDDDDDGCDEIKN